VKYPYWLEDIESSTKAGKREMNKMPLTHDEQMLDNIDAIISILKKYEAISEENVQILKANHKSLKIIIEELHKIRVNTS
jgi:hypothetical protein